MAERNVLATLLAPGDRILETGLSGLVGRVTAVRVGAEVVDITLDDGSRQLLCPFEICRVHREEAR